MSEPTFTEVRDELIRLYYAGEFAAAYDLVSRELPRHPKAAAQMLFWRVCLACRMDDTPLAISLLHEMLAAGVWYSPKQLLNDDDLRPLHGNPAFDAVVAACAARQAEAQARSRPSRTVLPPPDAPAPYPLLLGMHGNSATSDTAKTHWALARDQGYLVALGQSSQIVATGMYNWDDWDKAENEIATHLAEISAEQSVDPQRVLLGGFSMSGGLVAWLSLSGAIATPGFVAVAPYIPDFERFTTLFAQVAFRPVRGFIIAGEQDANCYPMALQLHEAMRTHGLACELETYAELGHDFPPDWPQAMERALTFVRG